jgi:ribosomal-protein-alanine N-acetyltransferase
VRHGNTSAQALYRKYHFEEVGVRRRYYRDTGEDALLMTVDFAIKPDFCAWLAERATALAAV